MIEDNGRLDNSLDNYITNTNKIRKHLLNRRKINCLNLVKKGLVKGLIGVDYALPFIIAGGITLGKYVADDKTPFVRNDVVEKASVEVVDDSLGGHLEKTSFDYNYNDLTFEHSTGWKKDEYGLYEKTVTSYMTEGIDFSNPKEILSLTEKEIGDKFIVSNIKTEKKSVLTDEEKLDTEECFIIVQHRDSQDELLHRKETFFEDFGSIFSYLIITALGGLAIGKVKKIVLKTYVRDSLREKANNFVIITEINAEELEKILKIREANLALLEDNCEVEAFQFRKKR